MPRFSLKSKEKLATCDSRIIMVCSQVIQVMDFTVIFGHRSVEEQQRLYAKGRKKEGNEWTVVDPSKIVTKIDGVNKKSMHNYNPSAAIDIAPWPVDWGDEKRFYLLAGHMLMAAYKLNITLRWGGDWDRDYDLSDQKFNDLGHFEVVG